MSCRACQVLRSSGSYAEHQGDTTYTVVTEMRCVINAQDGHRCGLGAGIGKCELVKLPVETEIAVAYLMEMRSAPFRSMFSSVPVEDREKALPTDRVKIDYE